MVADLPNQFQKVVRVTFAASANSASRKLDTGCDRTTEQKEEEDNILQTEAAAIKRLRINQRRRERGKKNNKTTWKLVED